jgi:hypothetical protein
MAAATSANTVPMANSVQAHVLPEAGAGTSGHCRRSAPVAGIALDIAALLFAQAVLQTLSQREDMVVNRHGVQGFVNG